MLEEEESLWGRRKQHIFSVTIQETEGIENRQDVGAIGWILYPQNSYVEVLTLLPQNVTIWKEGLTDVIFKVKSLGWVLI